MTPDEAIAALKELLLAEIQGVRHQLEEKDARYTTLLNQKTQGVLDQLRDKDALYTDRDTARQKAVEAALKAAQTGVDAAFAASEKAIGKSDQNAEKWRENANEWRAAMMDRETRFAARSEVDNEFKSLRTELASLKEARDQGVGGDRRQSDNKTTLQAGIGLILLLIALATFLLKSSGTTASPQVIYVPAPSGTQLPVSPPGTVPR